MTGVRGSQPLLLARTHPAALTGPHGPPQALLAPNTAGALAIDPPTLPQQDLMRCLPTPTRVIAGDLAQASSQTLLLGAGRPPGLALPRAVLTDHTARPALRDPETLLQNQYAPATALRGQNFPSANSLSMSISNACSATSFLSRWFSASSVFRRSASSAFIPP